MIVLSSRLDSTTRAIAAALRKALEEEPEEADANASPIALPVAEEEQGPRHLTGVQAVLALDAAQVRRAREAGVPTVLHFAPYFEIEDDEIAADRVFVVHEGLVPSAIEAGARRAQIRVCGPVAPDGWTPAEDRAALRETIGLDAELPWVVVRAEALERDDLAPALVQLSLVHGPVVWLFDVGLDPDLARAVRRQVPGYGLDAVMIADGEEALHAYQAADAVLGRIEGPEAIRAFATGAAFIAMPPRRGQLRLAHLLETTGLVDVADAPATLAVTLDAALSAAALEKGRAASAALEAGDGLERVSKLVDEVMHGPPGEPPRPSGLPRGFERLSARDDVLPRPREEERPRHPPDDDKVIDDELAALREKLGL